MRRPLLLASFLLAGCATTAPDPLIAPPTDDTVDLSSIDQAALRGRTTGEHAAIGSPATGELPTVRPHGARRRRVVDVVGLYLAPPENAIVLCVDEKSQI